MDSNSSKPMKKALSIFGFSVKKEKTVTLICFNGKKMSITIYLFNYENQIKLH